MPACDLVLHEEGACRIGELNFFFLELPINLQIDFLLDVHVNIVVRIQHIIGDFIVEGKISISGKMRAINEQKNHKAIFLRWDFRTSAECCIAIRSFSLSVGHRILRTP